VQPQKTEKVKSEKVFGTNRNELGQSGSGCM
jgi:hypothetical protein